MAALKLHQIPASPNSVRVRWALGYKRLAYEASTYGPDGFPGDRSEFVALSRQPRLPILTDGELVVFGSHSIVRHLEANYPDTPPLFTDDYAAFGEIERWEIQARVTFGEAVAMVFEQAVTGSADPEVLAKANLMFHEATAPIEEALAATGWLVGAQPTAADLGAGPMAQLAAVTEAEAARSPLRAYFREHLSLGEGRTRTADWIERLLAFDRVAASA